MAHNTMGLRFTPWLLVLAGALLGVTGCTEQPAAAPGRVAVPVSVAAARQRNVPVQVQAIGTVEAYATVSVKSQVSGPVTAVSFREGQNVKKGDLLFTIDPRPFQVALQQAEATLARDKAQLEHARAQERRYARLLEEGVIAREQYDTWRTSLESLEAGVRADEAAVEKARLDLSYCSIRAPMDGRTGSLAVHAGNLAKANDEPVLVVIHRVSPIYVHFAVPEQHLAEIKRRMAAEKLKVAALVAGEEGRPEEGFLSFVDNAVDASTGTIRLKAMFANGSRRLWPGQFVNTLLTLSEERGAVVVPSRAVQAGQSGAYVFVIKDDLTAEARPVRTGRSHQGDTVIESGLAPGEQVVTEGQIRLVAGSKVEIKPAGPGE